VNLEELRAGCSDLGIPLDASAEERFAIYQEALYIANRDQNLTRIPPNEFISRHVVDSLRAVWALGSAPEGKAIDIGSGAGFPGLPILICYPMIDMTLLDAHLRSLEFCQTVAEKLGLPLSVVHGRAEETARNPELRERFDLGFCRALSSFRAVAEMLAAFVKVGGHAVPHRTDADGDINPALLEENGWTLAAVREEGSLRFPVLAKTHALAQERPRSWQRLKRL